MLLALAFCLKLYPLAFAPVVAVHLVRREGRAVALRAAAVFAGVTAAMGRPLPSLPEGSFTASRRKSLRWLHVESLAATPLLVAERSGIGDATIIAGDPGSIDLAGTLPDLLGYATSALQAAAIVAVALLFWRGRQTDERLVTAFAAAVAAFVVPAKVLSPQFLIWIVPLAALVAGRVQTRLLGVLVAALVATQIELEGYRGLEPTDWAVAVLAARSVLLAVLLGMLLVALADRSPGIGRVNGRG